MPKKAYPVLIVRIRDVLRLETCLPPDHVLLTALKDPATRRYVRLHKRSGNELTFSNSSALHALEPLLSDPSPNTKTRTSAYPKCHISHRTTLPFPAPPTNASSDGTRTPEKPSGRSRSGSGASLASIGAGISSVVSGIGEAKLPVGEGKGRLNPFANLWGGREREKRGKMEEKVEASAAELPEISTSEHVDAEVENVNGDMTASVTSDGQKTPTTDSQTVPSPAPTDSPLTPDGFQVPAWTIDRTIKYAEITQSLGKAITRRIKDRLDGAPEKVVEKVIKFVSAAHPCYSSETSLLSVGVNTDEILHFRHADETSSTYQRFMGSVYDELYAHHLAAALVPKSPVVTGSALSGLRRRGSQKGKNAAVSPAPEEESEVDQRKREASEKARLHAAEEAAEEQAVVETDRIEAVVCELFYIRCVLSAKYILGRSAYPALRSLFSPATSDDGKHDIALSSRIAALNMLDLSLEHLGVVVKETVAEPGREAELAERNRRVESGLQKMIERVGNRMFSCVSIGCGWLTS